MNQLNGKKTLMIRHFLTLVFKCIMCASLVIPAFAQNNHPVDTSTIVNRTYDQREYLSNDDPHTDDIASFLPSIGVNSNYTGIMLILLGTVLVAVNIAVVKRRKKKRNN